jgi:hypothetical protein
MTPAIDGLSSRYVGSIARRMSVFDNTPISAPEGSTTRKERTLVAAASWTALMAGAPLDKVG